MICGPRIRSSPSPPGSASAPVTTSISLTSVLGTTKPMDPGLRGAFFVGLRGVTGAAELRGKLLRNLLPEGGGAREDQPHAREIDLAHGRMLDHAQHDGRHE